MTNDPGFTYQNFIVRQDPEQGHKDQTDWLGSPGQGQIARLRKVI